jgi:hypothetical protein
MALVTAAAMTTTATALAVLSVTAASTAAATVFVACSGLGHMKLA